MIVAYVGGFGRDVDRLVSGRAGLRHRADRLGRRLSRPSRRASAPRAPWWSIPGSIPHRHHAIRQNAAARRPRGGADLRRRAAAEIQQSDSGHSRRPMREGDFLPGRTAGQDNPGRRAQGARRRPHGRPPTARTIRRHGSDADRPRQAGDRQRHRVGDRGAGRRHRARAVLPHSRPARATTAIEEFAPPRDIQIWSADFPADDWRHVSAARVYDLAIKRLEAKGKGILLLHDIQPRTVAALPKILHELKARGYRIVHVVPATPERPATPTEPQQWQLHPASETVAISRWPKIPKFAFAGTAALPAPALSDLDWRNDRSRRRVRSGARAAFPCRGQRRGRGK